MVGEECVLVLVACKDAFNFTIAKDASASSASSCSASVSTYSQCPHQAVDELPRMTVAEQARDKHKLDTMQGQLGLVKDVINTRVKYKD